MYGFSSLINCCRLNPRVRRVMSRTCPLEFVEGLWRDAPLAPVIRDAEPKKLSLLRSRHRALRLVDLEPQLVGQEPAHRGHDPFAGAPAANIDVAVVGVPAKAVTASGQFFVEAVKHEIA